MRRVSDLFSDIVFDIILIAKIVVAIILRNSGRLNLGMLLFILSIIGSIFIPFGATILFIIFKLTNVLTISWAWIAAVLVADALAFRALKAD